MPAWFATLQRTEFDWQFYAESKTACKALNGSGSSGNCFWPRGKLLGGSSAINLMLYVRGNYRDYDLWAAQGNRDWNFDSVLPYFKKSEANHFPPFVYADHGKYHSDSGPLNIDFYGSSPFAKVFIDAGMEDGYPFISDINADEHIGYTYVQGTCYDRRRQSTAKAFLVPAKSRKNLRVIKHGLVTNILIDKQNRAYGIKYKRNGKTLEALAKKEVILSAGAIMSPVILMLSGIGPKEQLKKHKIPLKRDAPAGEHLIDHAYTLIAFQFDPTPTDPTAQLDATFNLAVHNTGPLTNVGISPLCAFINTVKGEKLPNVQLMYFWFTQNSPNVAAYIKTRQFKPEIAEKLLSVSKTHDIGAILVTHLHPNSTGHIRLNGSSICDKPIIKPRYFSAQDDLETMITAIRHQLSYTKSKSYSQKHGGFIRFPIAECDAIEFDSDAYWKCYVSYMAATLYHPVGTCKMGPRSDPEAVVDHRLRVRGIDRLRVIDASM